MQLIKVQSIDEKSVFLLLLLPSLITNVAGWKFEDKVIFLNDNFQDENWWKKCAEFSKSKSKRVL